MSMKKYIQQKEKFNIVHFGHKRMPSREGGVEIVVEEITTRMAALGHNVTCIGRRGHHVSGTNFDGESLKEYKGVKIRSVPTIDVKGLSAASSSFFATVKASFGNYDVVHIHAEGPAVFCWMPKLFGKKVICHCHGLDWDRPKWRGSFAGKYIKLGEKMMAKHADEIIVLSAAIKKYFKDTYNRETLFIPNGVNKPELAKGDLICDKWGIKSNSFFLALSRLTEEKCIHLLIKAYKNILTEKKLVIAGGSSDSTEYIERLHQLAADDPRIIFTGFVQGQLLEELYSNAYVYCLPSELEGMPLSLLEAMSYGNCCLTSDISECIDVIQDKGISFRSNDLQDLQLKLQMLSDNTELVEKHRNKASEYICSRYNWDEIVKEILYIYMRSFGI